jgi:DNA polymerase-3 subunit delta
MTVSVLSSYFNKLSKLAGLNKSGTPPGDLADAIGVNQYFLKDYQAALDRFSATEREAALKALLAADRELKGGSERDDRLILGLLLRRLTGGSTRNSTGRAA